MSPREKEKTNIAFESLCGKLDNLIKDMWEDENNGRHQVENYKKDIRYNLRQVIRYDRQEAQHRYNPLNLMGRIPGFSPKNSAYDRIAKNELYYK